MRSGITDILIILGRNQSIIEDHFDRSPELEEKLAAPGKEKMLEECLGISNLANIFFVRQQLHVAEPGEKIVELQLGPRRGVGELGELRLRVPLENVDEVGQQIIVEAEAVEENLENIARLSPDRLLRRGGRGGFDVQFVQKYWDFTNNSRFVQWIFSVSACKIELEADAK